jgi:hypothetical protein
MYYYCLIAGLPDIEFEDHKLAFSVASFKEEVQPHLFCTDTKLLDLFYMRYDNKNLLQYLQNNETEFDPRGNISKETMVECLRLMSEGITPKNKFFLYYFKTFISAYNKEEIPANDPVKLENRLTELYYRWAMNCGNSFIARWFEFKMNINNILSGFNCRKYQMPVEVVGNNWVAELIRTSNHRDFELSETFEDFDIYHRISEEPDLYDREKKIDLLKWQWLDEHTFFEYFSIEKIIEYLVKLEIIERWTNLSPAEGEKSFRQMIYNLKKSASNYQEKINIQDN